MNEFRYVTIVEMWFNYCMTQTQYWEMSIHLGNRFYFEIVQINWFFVPFLFRLVFILSEQMNHSKCKPKRYRHISNQQCKTIQIVEALNVLHQMLMSMRKNKSKWNEIKRNDNDLHSMAEGYHMLVWCTLSANVLLYRMK